MRDFDFVEPASVSEACALLAEDPEGSAQRFPGINYTAPVFAAEQVRNQGTVAGNLCLPVPSADMAGDVLQQADMSRRLSDGLLQATHIWMQKHD